jgi:hypothetical protein
LDRAETMEKRFYELSGEERAALAREAKAAGVPLMARWESISADFSDRWDERASRAAAWLAEAGSVADLGCGSMSLERHLRPDQTYVPVDVEARDGRTLVLDLNRPEYLSRLPKAAACALLGVLEYCYAPEDVLDAIRGGYDQAVVTFNVLTDQRNPEQRLMDGWVNHYTSGEVRMLFASHGFRIQRETSVDHGPRLESMFDLRPI